MDWTPIIGRRRPVEHDALRIATIVHQLGERRERRWIIESESRLQQLDHLVRHPIDLAYVLLDGLGRHRPENDPPRRDLAGRIRRLVGAPTRRRRVRAPLRPFDPGSWERWDDVLAYLSCRDLLRTEPGLRYVLTGRGAEWLEESVYPAEESLAPYRERCDLLRTVLSPRWPRQAAGAPLGEELAALDATRREAQIRSEADLLSHLFQTAFREPL